MPYHGRLMKSTNEEARTNEGTQIDGRKKAGM